MAIQYQDAGVEFAGLENATKEKYAAPKFLEVSNVG